MKIQIPSIDKSFSATCDFFEPEKYKGLKQLLSSKELCLQGGNYSYTPAGLSSTSKVISSKYFNRILDFNPENLDITVEAGITLKKLYDFLAPKGLYLSVQPGFHLITVGGCISFNVHGKNQYLEGCFKNLIKELTIIHPVHGTIVATKGDDFFDLVVGGMGLFGYIKSAKLSLAKLKGNAIDTCYTHLSNLNDTIEKLKSHSKSADMLYSWNDFSSSSKYSGRGFLVTGYQVKNKINNTINFEKSKISKSYPFSFFNKYSLNLINTYYYYSHINRKRELLNLFDFLFPAAKKGFYYRMMGPSGFFESQVLIPNTNAHNFAEECTALVKKENPLIPLATCKIFQGVQNYLNFDGSGIVFTFDFLNSNTSKDFIAKLDQLSLKHFGISNLSKNSLIDEKTAILFYKDKYYSFKEKLLEFDKERIFKSELSQRLGL